MSTAKPNFLPNHIRWYAEETADRLAQQLAEQVADCLDEALLQRPRASLAVSGGRTPTTMFSALSQIPIAWSKIDITLVDERWVGESDPASNAALVRQYLLQNAAASANFIPMLNGKVLTEEYSKQLVISQCNQALSQLTRPIDVVILGMGNDGHTASLFPNCANLIPAISDINTSLCMASTAPVAPKQRITLTAQQIHLARNKFLHLIGDDKLTTLEQAMELRNPIEMPIFAFLQRPINIYWSPTQCS